MEASPRRALVEHLARLEDPRVERAKRHALLARVPSARWGDRWGDRGSGPLGGERAVWAGQGGGVGALPGAAPGQPFPRDVRPRVRPTGRAPVGGGLGRRDAGGGRGAADPGGRARWADGAPFPGSGGAGKAARPLASAWARVHRLGRAPGAGDDHSNASPAERTAERTAFPLRRRQLARAGGLVTTRAALGGQAEGAEPVRAQDADDVRALTEHPLTLSEEGVATVAPARASGLAEGPPQAWDHGRPAHTGHGRREIREHGGLADPEILAARTQAVPWPGVRASGRAGWSRRRGVWRTRSPGSGATLG
jgi:hypothetical protein